MDNFYIYTINTIGTIDTNLKLFYMAKFFGQQSKYSVRMYWLNVVAAFGFIICLLYISLCLVFQVPQKATTPLAVFIVFVIFLILYAIAYILFRKADRESECFWKGIKSEDNIARILRTLPDDYSIYSDVVIKPGNGNIDFVVIGPTGLYAIEVKSHSGFINFNGSELIKNNKPLEKDFIKQAMFGATSLNRYFYEQLKNEIFVKPVIVFSSSWAKMKFGLNPINNVYIIQKRWIKKLISDQPKIDFLVDREQIEQKLLSLVITK